LKYCSYLFSMTPMMDWTGASQKAKHNQHLTVVVARHAVPNAVPAQVGRLHEQIMS
jgi:hypothetical protein